jgi:bifunctional aspartokinase / homoserine dehydrogenase 1
MIEAREPLTERPDGLAVLKFGGTSLGDAERIRAVIGIVSASVARRPTVVVASAMASVTSDLIAAAHASAARTGDPASLLAPLAARHLDAARDLVPEAVRTIVINRLSVGLGDLHSLLQGVSLVRDCSPRVLDAIIAQGELFASILVAAALRAHGIDAEDVDARTMLATDETFGNAIVDRDASDGRIRERLAGHRSVPVITGFIAAAADGSTTTLGRGGSDLTASLVGAALGASVIEIWTDVNGVMSADPRLVPQAFPIPQLGYTELMELSHFGAKVVHPPAVTPARDAGIPLIIRNTFSPAFEGTRVLPDHLVERSDEAFSRRSIRGVSSIDGVALCRLEGGGMVGVPGVAGRLFHALARDGINVILISQASSEHSICFAVTPTAAAPARRRVDAEFAVERRAGVIEPLIVEDDLAIVAAVGEAMRETPGIAGRLFDVLGRNGVNVRAIAQGSTERNISLVIARSDVARALRLVHDAFFLSRVRTLQVFLAGTGRVGAALLDQLAAEAPRLEERLGLRLVVSGIGRSRLAAIAQDGLPLHNWREAVATATDSADRLIAAARESPNAHRVFVDCTASEPIAAAWEDLLAHGVAIVTANKIGLSESMERYHRLQRAARRGNGLYAETTVGAGLPVLRPIADLVATGDTVSRIEGVLSGTLSFLFGRLDADVPFSEAVREAHALGFTEPDPREDLSGRDVARKLLILAREAGFSIEPDAVRVQPILPGLGWEDLTLAGFWDRLPEADAVLAAQRDAARARGRVLRYLGSVDAAGARIEPGEVASNHPAAALSPGDNLIAVSSSRYAERPLIIRGPGAGPEVTAAGVFADILRAGLESR